MTNRRSVGNCGEDIACAKLRELGCEIIARNYCIRGGEIDIIAKDGETVAFVEVKQRSGNRYGEPIEAMTVTKCRRIIKTAMRYIAEHKLDDVPVRFDVIEVLNNDIRYTKSAFDVTDMY